jgi:hypothetical protein
MATKKQFQDFNKAMVKYLTAIGATKLVNNNALMDHYSVETIGGNLTVKIETDEHYKEFKSCKIYSIYSCFEDTSKVNEIFKDKTYSNKERLNPYSSKWNFHYMTAQDTLTTFTNELNQLLIK